MDATLHTLPAPERAVRTHVTVPIADMAEWMVRCEDVGEKRAMEDWPTMRRMIRLIEMSETFDLRVRLRIGEIHKAYL